MQLHTSHDNVTPECYFHTTQNEQNLQNVPNMINTSFGRYCNGLNVALPTYFTSNNHEAYQCQINSQFLVTQLGIEPGTLG